MTERVIDGFETVEVEVEHREAGHVAGILDGCDATLRQLPAVGQPGQRLVQRGVTEVSRQPFEDLGYGHHPWTIVGSTSTSR